jgi:glycosyltransferase involved in cell wall biosynthesis
MVEATGHSLHFDSLLEESAVTIVPLLAAGGVRVKILEAWSKGIPVVSTTIGAEGLRAEHGRNLLIADSPADFAEAVIRVSDDPELARALIAGGLQTIRTHYDWRSVYSAWDEVHRCESYSSSHMFPA